MPTTSPYPGNAIRLYGPPGTGKTTRLVDRIEATVVAHGPQSIALTSFTKTAAQEALSRFVGKPVRPDDDYIGTLHSFAWNALGRPPMALDSKIISDWNTGVDPTLRITADGRRNGGDSGAVFTGDPSGARTGDELLSALDRLRATLTPVEDWPPNITTFAKAYTSWKRSIGAVDFTDMIDQAWQAARDGLPAPGTPEVFVSDEAQDMTPIEFELSRAWGSLCRTWVIAGDDDQAINRWRGADPSSLLDLYGEDVTDIVLDRSHRVPEAVRRVAERWIRRLPHRREKAYGPRLDDAGDEVWGAAFGVAHKLNDPDLVADLVAETDSGRTVMVLATCNYQLEVLVRNLRNEGVPFHNPFRPSEARWNPLGKAREGAVTTAERIGHYLSLVERDWTGADLTSWLELVKLEPAGMRPGSKKAAARLAPREPVAHHDLAALFATEQALEQATGPDLDWLSSALLAARRPAAEYPLHVARLHGHRALAEQPRLVVGTIHSVKGAGADIVYLCPDVSPAAARTMADVGGRGEVIRQFYVGMTRAKQQLRVLAPGSSLHLCGEKTPLIPPDLEVLPL